MTLDEVDENEGLVVTIILAFLVSPSAPRLGTKNNLWSSFLLHKLLK